MKNKDLLIKQLQHKISSYSESKHTVRPASGWIKAIRQSLGMTLEQLAQKLNVSKQNVQILEKREKEYSITMRSLQQVANALDMQMVYAIIPKTQTLEEYIEMRAEALAREIVMRTSQQMALENQQLAEEQLEYAIEKRKREILQENPKILWD